MDVAITGATGLVGSRFVELAPKDLRIQALDRKEGFDLLAPDREGWNRKLAPVDALVHAGGLTDVDQIERERSQGPASPAWRVNAESTRMLADICATRGVPMIYLSTDFVFPVMRVGLFRTTDPPAAKPEETSWYGWTKLGGERAVLESQDRNGVLRITFPYRAHHPKKLDHARRILHLYDEGRLYPLFTDQSFTPTFVDDAIHGLQHILSRGLAGVFHVASRDVTTPYEFGREVLERNLRDPAKIKAGSFEAFLKKNPTPRPKRGGLDVRQNKALGLPASNVSESLDEFVRQRRALKLR